MSLSRFFIDRPVFAWVIAIVIMLAGAIAAFSLPWNSIPPSRRRRWVVNAVYPGADAAHRAEFRHPGDRAAAHRPRTIFSISRLRPTPTARCPSPRPSPREPIPTSPRSRSRTRCSRRWAQLPSQVQQLGVTVAKSQTNFLLVIAVYDTAGRYSNMDISDFIISKMQDPLSRVTGVGNTQVFGAQYAMRIWLDPYKLHNYSWSPRMCATPSKPRMVQVSAGSNRRPARRPRPGAERHRHRPVPTPDAGPVPRHHSQNHPGWRGGASLRCGADRIGRRHLCDQQPDERPPRLRHRHYAVAGRKCAQAGGRSETARGSDGADLSRRA